MSDISKSQEELLKDIFSDGKVDFSEMKKIRDIADEKFKVLEEAFGSHNEITAFQQSCDVTAQLLQNVVLKLKKEKLSGFDEAICKDAIHAQLNYLSVLPKLFLDKM